MVVVALQDANCNSNSFACADHGLKFGVRPGCQTDPGLWRRGKGWRRQQGWCKGILIVHRYHPTCSQWISGMRPPLDLLPRLRPRFERLDRGHGGPEGPANCSRWRRDDHHGRCAIWYFPSSNLMPCPVKKSPRTFRSIGRMWPSKWVPCFNVRYLTSQMR